MSTNRLEAFSDGVFAIAITLLVLDIHIPEPGPETNLAHELGVQWPSYAAYVVSFLTIGIIWINHHVMIGRLARIDHVVLTWNLLLLMSVAVLPFTTALMAAYLKEGSGEDVAAAIYGGSLLVMGLLFAATHRHILFARPELLSTELSRERRRQILRRSISGLIPYLVATALAPVSPYATLAICGAVAVFYALPIASSRELAA